MLVNCMHYAMSIKNIAIKNIIGDYLVTGNIFMLS